MRVLNARQIHKTKGLKRHELLHLTVFCRTSPTNRHSRNSVLKFNIKSTGRFQTKSWPTWFYFPVPVITLNWHNLKELAFSKHFSSSFEVQAVRDLQDNSFMRRLRFRVFNWALLQSFGCSLIKLNLSTTGNYWGRKVLSQRLPVDIRSRRSVTSTADSLGPSKPATPRDWSLPVLKSTRHSDEPN